MFGFFFFNSLSQHQILGMLFDIKAIMKRRNRKHSFKVNNEKIINKFCLCMVVLLFQLINRIHEKCSCAAWNLLIELFTLLIMRAGCKILSFSLRFCCMHASTQQAVVKLLPEIFLSNGVSSI